MQRETGSGGALTPRELREQRRWEKRVIRRAKRGDAEAFGEIYRAFAEPLRRRVLLPRLGDLAAAEDALSETFGSALQHLDRYRDQGRGIWPWLARIAANKALDMQRRSARTGRVLCDLRELLPSAEVAWEDPEHALEAGQRREELAAEIERVLARINPRYRRAIELRLVEERTREECADLLEVRIGTFDVLLLRALRAFRGEWSRAGGGRGRGGEP